MQKKTLKITPEKYVFVISDENDLEKYIRLQFPILQSNICIKNDKKNGEKICLFSRHKKRRYVWVDVTIFALYSCGKTSMQSKIWTIYVYEYT